MYRRLLRFLRPHVARMGGAVGASAAAAIFDAFSFSLLIPFLNALFGLPTLLPANAGWVNGLLSRTVGVMLQDRGKMEALQLVMLVIVGAVAVKNFFSWLAGNLGAQLQEFVTRDVRDAVYTHLQRLPLRYYTKTKAGQIISR